MRPSEVQPANGGSIATSPCPTSASPGRAVNPDDGWAVTVAGERGAVFMNAEHIRATYRLVEDFKRAGRADGLNERAISGNMGGCCEAAHLECDSMMGSVAGRRLGRDERVGRTRISGAANLSSVCKELRKTR